MGDSEVLPKRRKLDPPDGEPNGQKMKDAFSFEKESNEKKTTSYNMPNDHKEIKWNFKLVRPEVLKCCRSIVKGLNRTGPGGKRSDENETVPLQQSDLTPLKAEKKESAPKGKLDPDVVKRCVYKETTSAACVLPTNCSKLVTISHEKLGPSKEINNGCTVNNQAPTQQQPLERLILDPLTKEKLHHEIRNIIKEHTREAMDRAESLKSRISTLESENRWLKHKVTILYSALRKELTGRKQNKVPATTSTNSTLQDKPQVKSNEGGSLEALLQPQPHPVTAIGNKAKDGASQSFQKAITTDTNDSMHFDSEAVDKGTAPPAVGSGPQIRPLHNTIIPSVEHNIANHQTKVSTGSHGPIASIGQDTTLSSIHLPNQFLTLSKTPVQTVFGPPTTTTSHNSILSSVVTSQHKVDNIPSNGNTSKSTPNPVFLLCQVLDEILASSTKELPDHFALNPLCRLEAPKLSKNFHEPVSHTATGMSPPTTPSGNEGVLCKQPPSPHNRKISMKLFNAQTEKTLQDDKKVLLDQHRAKGYLSPISLDQEISKVESKHSKLLGNTCIVENNRKKETETPLLANNGTSHNKIHAETQLTDSQLQLKIALPAASASPVSSNSQPAKSIPVKSTGIPSVLGSSGQSVGLLDGISMLAQAAGLGNKTNDQILCPEKSSKKQTPPLGRTSGESSKTHTQDLSQRGLNNHALESYCLNSKSHPSQGSFISQPEEPQRHKLVVRQHVSTKGSLKGHCTNVITRYVEKHQNPLNVKEQKLDKTELLNPRKHVNNVSLQHEERPTHSRKDNNVPVTERFYNGDPELAAVSPNKFKTMPYHANSEEGNDFLSPPRFYNSRECQEHTPRQAQNTTWARNHVISKPRYLPYPPLRPKVQQTPFVPTRSNIQYVPKVNDRQSPKPDGVTRLTPPLNGDASRWPHIEEKSAKSSNEELFDQLPKFSRLPETSSNKVRLTAPCSANTNTSSNYNKESLLLQLLHSDRVPYIPHYSPTSNVQTINAANLPSKSSETGKRCVYLQPKRHVQNSIQNPVESSLCKSDKTKSEGVALPSKPPLSVGEGSFNSASFNPTSTPNPQIELSHSCQRYITQLRRSPLQLSYDNSTYSTSKLLSHAESEALELNDSSQQGLKFPILYSSMKRQATCQQQGYDAHEMHLQASISEHKKDNNSLPQYQRPHLVLYHHKKITNQRQQEHLSEDWLKSYSGSPTPVSELSEKRRLPCTAMNGEPRKQE